MAYNVPTNPFLQGTVLNTDRFTNYFLQADAHKKALGESYNKKLEELSSSITPTGIDTKESVDENGVKYKSDFGLFMDAKNEWMNFVRNKDNDAILRNSSNPKYAEVKAKADKLYQAPFFIKEASTKKISTGEKGLTNSIARPDIDAKDAIDAHLLPISDPRRKELNMTMYIEPKPFDMAAHTTNKQKLYRESELDTPIHTPSDKPMFLNEKQTFGNTPDQIKASGEYGVELYKANPSYKRMIDKVADEIYNEAAETGDSKKFQKWNEIYKKYTGKELNLDPTHSPNSRGNADLAAAFEFANPAFTPTVKTKVVEDTLAKEKFDQERKKEMARFTNALGYEYEKKKIDYQEQVKAAKATGKEVPLFDAWSPIQKLGDALGVGHEIPVNKLPAEVISVLVKHAKDVYDDKITSTDGNDVATSVQKTLNLGSLKLKYNPNGTVNLYTVKKVTGKYDDGTPRDNTDLDVDLGTLDKAQLNLLVTKGMKERGEQLDNISTGSQETPLPKVKAPTFKFDSKIKASDGNNYYKRGKQILDANGKDVTNLFN